MTIFENVDIKKLYKYFNKSFQNVRDSKDFVNDAYLKALEVKEKFNSTNEIEKYITIVSKRSYYDAVLANRVAYKHINIHAYLSIFHRNFNTIEDKMIELDMLTLANSLIGNIKRNGKTNMFQYNLFLARCEMSGYGQFKEIAEELGISQINAVNNLKQIRQKIKHLYPL